MINFKKLFYGKEFHEKIFLYIFYGSWIIYFITLIGTIQYGSEYLDFMREGLKIYVALFLIIKFNPFTNKTSFTQFDRRIAFQAGVFLLSTTILNNIIINYTDTIKHFFTK